MTVELNSPDDLSLDVILRVAFENEAVVLGESARKTIQDGRARFESLIEAGVPCYGVTTGLGKLVDATLDDASREALPRNILLARSAAVGDPMPREAVRAMMLLKLGNLISGADGTSVALAGFICDRLNDDFVPWVPVRGHGMAADATAHTHCFQTLIGEGYVMDSESGERREAAEALARRGVAAFEPGQKEGLALLNGIAAAPAFAMYGLVVADEFLAIANAVAAASLEGAAVPRDSTDPALGEISPEPGIGQCIEVLQNWLAGSEIKAFKLQAPISSRVVPQVHGAFADALASLSERIQRQAKAFSDNPWMSPDGRFLSVGSFHNQHLVNQLEAVVLSLVHVACLSERRLHRLLDPATTGLNAQLAARPGLDAGLVVVHKAAIDHVARLRALATPVSVMTSETSLGQEDYMSLAIPTVERLLEAVDVGRILLASELLAACVALDQRAAKPGEGVRALHEWTRQHVATLLADRSPGPDIETLVDAMQDEAFHELISRFS